MMKKAMKEMKDKEIKNKDSISCLSFIGGPKEEETPAKIKERRLKPWAGGCHLLLCGGHSKEDSRHNK